MNHWFVSPKIRKPENGYEIAPKIFNESLQYASKGLNTNFYSSLKPR